MAWTRQRWIVIASLTMAGQLACIFALHTRQPILARMAGGELKTFPKPTLPEPASEFESLKDPTIFAGANPHGFSAAVWLTAPESSYVLSNSIPEPRFLEFQRARTPSETETIFEPRTAPLPLLRFNLASRPGTSVLWLEGELASRAPAKLPEIPVQFGSDVLSNTVVQVGAQADGFPISARILTGSGSRGVDLAALETSRKIRFAPLPIQSSGPGAALQWGLITFQWFTAATPSTNVATQAAAATNTPKP